MRRPIMMQKMRMTAMPPTKGKTNAGVAEDKATAASSLPLFASPVVAAAANSAY